MKKYKPIDTSKELNKLKRKGKKYKVQKKAKRREEKLEELKIKRAPKSSELYSKIKNKKLSEQGVKRRQSIDIETRGKSKVGVPYVPQGDGTRASTPRKTIIAPELEATDELEQGLYSMSEEEWSEYSEHGKQRQTGEIPTLTVTQAVLDRLQQQKSELESLLYRGAQRKAQWWQSFITIVEQNSQADAEDYEAYLFENQEVLFETLDELFYDSDSEEQMSADYTNITSILNFGDGYFLED